MNKTIETIVLIGALGLAGCQSKSGHLNDINNKYNRESTVESGNLPVQKNDTSIYSFDDFGKVSPKSYIYTKWAVVADMDGDGDLDIVTLDNGGDIAIYKNNIPQKGKK